MGERGSAKPKLQIPHLNTGSEGKIKYVPHSYRDKIVHDYTGIPINEVENLNFIEYAIYLRDGYIFSCNNTESGRDYLEKCWIAEQKEPDREALRTLFGR